MLFKKRKACFFKSVADISLFGAVVERRGFRSVQKQKKRQTRARGSGDNKDSIETTRKSDLSVPYPGRAEAEKITLLGHTDTATRSAAKQSVTPNSSSLFTCTSLPHGGCNFLAISGVKTATSFVWPPPPAQHCKAGQNSWIIELPQKWFVCI